MARTAKTKHVMDLVGSRPAGSVPPAVREIEADAAAPSDNKQWGVKAVVTEVINQELWSVAERFHIELTDSNLWELTKAVIEEVRPSFAFSEEEMEEKSGKIRGQVIKVMTKTAIKISADSRNK